MADPGHPRAFERFCLGIIVAALVLVLLVTAKFFLIPMAVAVLLFSLIGSAIDGLVRLRLGRFAIPHWLATLVVISAVGLVLMQLFGFAYIQVETVRGTLPSYIERGQQALSRLFSLVGEDVAHGVIDGIRNIDLNAYLRIAAGSAGNMLTVTVMLGIYVGFMFTERGYFDAKLSRLFPQEEQAAHIRQILSSIRRSVHHYLLVKTAISALTGAVVYGVLLLFGLDFAALTALLSFLLNFIPTLGSIIATGLPVLIALAQFDSPWPILGVLVAVGGVQFLMGNILDPMLTGRALQMSSLAIILSLTLWSAIWGVVGMFLAVPIMAMIMIVCAHVPALRPIAILLSRDGDLTFAEAKEDESSPPARRQA